ncbi:hypothetical protein RF11_01617 [Thelohanellus kitauei]|uniref:Uncharacterized protein n=1 Tax=Thelohanellus kitauei TaxID=669202 RepID=A0A0C2IXS2_THEKT|nr:hypothetical protein RF11_01615 [Thelohanellus kitauei]KII70164.1 hypothetical protein RF11_01617 [Thelohanellus kitauei]
MTLIVAYLSLCIAAKGTLGSTHSLEFKSGPPESTGFSLVKSLNNLAVPRPSCSKGQTIYNSFIAYSNLVTTRNAVASTKVTITAAKIKKDTHLCILVCQQSAWFPIDSGAPENEGIEKVKVHLKFAGCEADNVGEVAKACNDEKAAPCMKSW